MEIKQAVQALSGLANENRLRVFRMLVRAGPQGMGAGDLAQALSMANPTLSFHLAHMTHAGLLEQRREGRNIIYAVHFAGFRTLISYLLEDCCQGKKELCGSTNELLESSCDTD